MFFRRNVTRDTELRGQKFKAGDKVSIWYISANRDEDIFPEPFKFDIKRTPNQHVAFGGGGPHFCLGASLARMEMSILFEELVKRVATVERTGPVKRLRSNFINGLKHSAGAPDPQRPQSRLNVSLRREPLIRFPFPLGKGPSPSCSPSRSGRG